MKLDLVMRKKIRLFACKISLFLLAVFLVILMVTIFNKFSHNSAHSDANYYRAAVVEYVPLNLTSIRATILANVGHYVEIIGTCKKSSVDIVVFPECGLVGCYSENRNFIIKEVASVVPLPATETVPCQQSDINQILSPLSCAAQRNQIYVAVNLLEKVSCPDNDEDVCPRGNEKSEILLFNTNVVFDRNGKIVARYRKFNLFVERTQVGINSTASPELSTFTTDFDVTFGIIICFDIIFKQPSYSLIHEKNVTDVIFSGAVYSQLPFLVLTSLGAGWAYTMNVTLLLSDLPVRFGSIGGSGIFNGRFGARQILMQEHYDSRILIADVPKRTTLTPSNTFNVEEISNFGSNFNNSLFIVDTTLINDHENCSIFENASYISNDLLQSEFSHTNEEFTCTVRVVWKQNENFHNRSELKFSAFAGKRNFTTASVENYVEACGLTLRSKYENGTYKDVPNFDDSTIVTVLSVNIFATSAATSLIVIPSTLDINLYPLNVSYFTFDSFVRNYNGNERNIINMNLIRPVSNLVTFAFYKLPEKSNPGSNLYYYSNETDYEML